MAPESMLQQVKDWATSRGLEVHCSSHEEPPDEIDYRKVQDPDFFPGDLSGVVVAMRMDLPSDQKEATYNPKKTAKLLVWLPSSRVKQHPKPWFTYQKSEYDATIKSVINGHEDAIADALDRSVTAFSRDHVYWPPIKKWLASLNTEYSVDEHPPGKCPIAVHFPKGWGSEERVRLHVCGEGAGQIIHTKPFYVQQQEGLQTGRELLEWIEEMAMGGALGEAVAKHYLRRANSAEENQETMVDRECQLAFLGQIIDQGLGSPHFEDNAKYPIKESSGVPRIAYSDVKHHRNVIRVDSSSERKSFWDDLSAPVIARYNSIESLVDDGWRLDLGELARVDGIHRRGVIGIHPMTDREYQIQNLQRIIDGALRSPFFKDNPKYPIQEASGAPRITYSDVMDCSYVIRVDCSPERNSFWDDTSAPVLASYDSIEALVDDGWRLD